MNLKAIKPSYGDFGRVARGAILKDVSKELARKLIAGGAYVEATAVDLKAGEKSAALSQDRGKAGAATNELREDGPTIAEYVSAGYLASSYPPRGYASKSTDDEVREAVLAEAARSAEAAAAAEAELEKLTNKQLQELAASEGTAVESDDNKASLIKKIMSGRAAKS